MSIHVLSWVRKSALTSDSRELLVLLALADRANDDGTGCWPSVRTMALESRCSERTVQRILHVLRERGLIRRGDQRLVVNYRIDKRPVVYDIILPAIQERGDMVSPRQRSGVTHKAERGDMGGRSGVTRMSPKPSLETTLNRGMRTCDRHFLAEPCRSCAADKLVGDNA